MFTSTLKTLRRRLHSYISYRVRRAAPYVLTLAGAGLLGSCASVNEPFIDSLGERLPAEVSREVTSTAAMSAAAQIVKQSVAEGMAAGAVLVISRRGQIVERSAFGYAQLFDAEGMKLENPVVMTPGHVFDLASLTKVFATTFAIMMLVDAGVLALDVPVKTYLPKFSSPEKDNISIRHLLTHTAGLAPWKPTYFHARDRREAFTYITSLPLDYPVGEERHYSDLGFMLLGYIVEKVSGKSLDSYLSRNLYEPLGLRHTGFRPLESAIGPLVATSQGNPFERKMVEDPDFGYLIHEDPSRFDAWREYTLLGEVNDGNSWYAHAGVAGHAGLFSTADGLTRLITLLMDDGLYKGLLNNGSLSTKTRLIGAETISEFLTPDQSGNGLGWAMSSDVLPVTDMPAGAFGHTGFTGTYVFANPAQSLIIVLLTNRQNAGVDENGQYPSLSPLRRAVVDAAMSTN